MTIKDFISKAIEGGWDKELLTDRNIEILEDGTLYATRGEDVEKEWCSKYEILLDPLAWKAVGKVEGWQREHKGCGGNMVCPRYGSYCCMEGWKANMHRLIDALAEGKRIEEFLKTI